MKVLMINGSPHAQGTTARALQEMGNEFNSNGIDYTVTQVGDCDISGCVGCGFCKANGKCFKDDIVNEVACKLQEYDGIVVGSPVYFAGINGTLKSFLDRLFCSTGGMPYKPACAVCVARRAGTTVSIDQIDKYFTISNMPVVSSQYWNMVHGSNGKDAESDVEGLQTARILARNMAWLIRCIEAGKKQGIETPKLEEHIKTNFIR